MEKANAVVNEIMIGKASWNKLFQPHTFFTQDYRYYLRVIAAARTKDSQLKWSGLVESKLRHLVMKLEQLDNIKLAHPFNKGFETEIECSTEDEAITVAQGGAAKPMATKSEGEDEKEGIKVYTTSFYVGLILDTSKLAYSISYFF